MHSRCCYLYMQEPLHPFLHIRCAAQAWAQVPYHPVDLAHGFYSATKTMEGRCIHNIQFIGGEGVTADQLGATWRLSPSSMECTCSDRIFSCRFRGQTFGATLTNFADIACFLAPADSQRLNSNHRVVCLIQPASLQRIARAPAGTSVEQH